MANNNNITNFTAADIEKYHKGLLSSKERHDLEKAALDDPFLADALEGYVVAGGNASADIAELQQRLAAKVEGAKVIPMNAAPKNSFRTLRAAALIAFVAGASFLFYKLGFNKKQGEIAEATDTTKEKNKITDTTVKIKITENSTTSPGANEIKTENPTSVKSANEASKTLPDKETKPGKADINNLATTGETAVPEKIINDITVSKATETNAPVVTAPAKRTDEKADLNKVNAGAAQKKEVAREEVKNKAINKEQDKDIAADRAVTQQSNRNVAATSNRRADNNQYNNSNVFRGRVTDADNNGVPFANVTNIQDDNAGTYTDAKGYFNLTYPDTVLNVQVRSIGFENTNTQLRNNVATNQVVLPDDRKTLSEVVLSNQKPNSIARSRDGNMKLEEPEPADGWENYDTYLVNNLKLPENLKSKQNNTTNAVEVSFEVDKNGAPTNFKIEKSLCTQCDKEAIRLVKDGPKWKRKAKKGRTTVTIYF